MQDGKNADGLHQQGLLLVERGLYAEAIRSFEESLAETQKCEIWNDWAIAQALVGNLQEAETGFRKALALQPGYKDAQRNLSILVAKALTSITPSAAPAANIWDTFVASVQRIPQQDPALPRIFQEAFQKPRSDSEYFVRECFELVRKLPAEILPRAIELLSADGWRDHRCRLVLALLHAEKTEWDAAVKQLRAAWEIHPLDLFTERLLIQFSHEWHKADPSVPDPYKGIEEYLAGHFCGKPWSHLEFSPLGDVYPCCPGILPVPVGNAKTQSVEETLSSPVLKAVRESILDGNFRYCSKINCPQIVGRNLPTRNEAAGFERQPSSAASSSVAEKALAKLYPVLPERYPIELSLAYDKTCNLACPSCRTDFYTAGREEQNLMETRYEKYILEMAERAGLVFMDGSGEVFFSKHSRRILGLLTRERYPNLKLQIISNGVLFDRKAWDAFDLKGRLNAIYISIDAARPETYKIVRRGGDFERLMENLEFMKALRENEGESFRWELHFVVSSRNFREMPEFVRLAKRLHADWVIFSAQRNWGHVAPLEMKQLAVFNPEHPQHTEFLGILHTPELCDPIVYPGVLSGFQVDIARTDSSRSAHNVGPSAVFF